MIALWFAALLALATPAPAPPLALSVSLSASRVPALAPVTVAVVLVSRERKPTTLEFPTPDLFFVQVRDASGAVVYDSRTGHKPIPIHRSFDVEPGRNKIASFDWNGLDDERRTPAVPGSYVVHVEMPALRATLAADAALTIEAPQTIESVLSAPKPSVVTLAGIAERNGALNYLHDDTGTIKISHPLGLAPQGRFFVRGELEKIDEDRTFVIERFAPAAENLAPQATPTARATATPK